MLQVFTLFQSAVYKPRAKAAASFAKVKKFFPLTLLHLSWIAPLCALLIQTPYRMASTSTIAPPVCPRDTHLTTIHDKKDWNDPYYWLRYNEEDPRVMKYILEENEYMKQQMSHTTKLQANLFEEMKARVPDMECSVPYRYGDWYYYKKMANSKQYPVYCRKKDDPDIGREEILLDVNELAEGKDFCEIGIMEISPDGHIMAYSYDEDGDEDFELVFKDLRTGNHYDESILGTETSFEWANDNKHVFYTKIDPTHRPYQVFRHELGTDPEKDVLVYQEDDQRFYLSLDKSRNDKYIFIECVATVTTEVRYINADKPLDEFRVFATRKQAVEYKLTNNNGLWMMVTNDNAKNFKLLSVPEDQYVLDDFSKFREEIPHRADVKLDDIDCFTKYMAIYERERGYTTLRIRNLLTGNDTVVDVGEGTTISPDHNHEQDAVVLRITYCGMITPDTVLDYNMSDGTRIIRKEQAVIGFDKSKYESVREYATAKDGTLIPITLSYKKGMEKNGENRVYLYGYGSYGYSNDPWFSLQHISMLDRGVIWAIAHIRGGGEMGRAWYESGKLMNKKNTFEDFIASAQHLIAKKYTNPSKLGCRGASAGGLLMGSVVNMAPHLFKAVIADVPFVDVINTMLDESLPLVVNEYEEWGNPNILEEFNYMLSYSPYDNIEAKAYPAILAESGMNDPRVPYWEPVKYVAKLRQHKTDKNLLILKTTLGQGHGGASGRFDAFKEEAFQFAFILDQLGLNERSNY